MDNSEYCTSDHWIVTRDTIVKLDYEMCEPATLGNIGHETEKST